jgi:hypothetical protein
VTVAIETNRRASVETVHVIPPIKSGPPPVVWWAWAGAVFVAIELYTLTAWVTSGNATPTVAVAADVPDYVKVAAIVIQAVCVLVFLGTLVYVVRGCLRERQFTFEAVLTVVGLSMWWLDPVANYIRPQLFYNSYYVNLGSWTSNMPGWLSPNGHLLPEGVLVEGPIYGSMVLIAMLTRSMMRAAKRRFPEIGVPGLIAAGFGGMMIFDFVLEIVINSMSHAYTWGSTVSWLTLFPDEVYRFPVYEAVFGAFVFAPAGVLLYFRDDRGRSVAERGVDQIARGPRTKGLYRTLAVAGLLNTCFLLGYVAPVAWIGLHVDRSYANPSYLTNGMCGPGTSYPCPEPGAPIQIGPDDHAEN